MTDPTPKPGNFTPHAARPAASTKPEATTTDAEMATGNPALARSAGDGETPHPLATNTTQRRPEHGLRRRGSEPAGVAVGTRPTGASTRYVHTGLGVLSYAELAPHLARAAAEVEYRIESGDYDQRAADDLLLHDLQHDLCGALLPEQTGWRRHDVRVGTHTPPPYYQVPVLVRTFARDLDARCVRAGTSGSDLLLELLAFAEGRILSIHPFPDLNGRTTRLFLRLLLRRLDLPALTLVPERAALPDYLAALRAADRLHWQPLMRIWQRRLEASLDELFPAVATDSAGEPPAPSHPTEPR
ncbi:MAG: hypothetical protein EA400_11415 [Chromatiaceae bacterium]|nr:MAG: hypothetical protein EA400_11415 [Chromatiaceae bacterium]